LKRTAAFVALLLALVSALVAQTLSARIEGEQLHILAPRVHLLTGEAFQRLHDGATVNYELQLTARADKAGKALARAIARFSVSYDLWEEKFAITRLGSSPRSVSRLTATAAEAWCVDNISMPVGALPPTQQFWVRLDYRAEPSGVPSDQSQNSSSTLSSLVDIFSRRPRSEQVHGSEDVGPLRLADLRKR
jgi:hypothetical protein